MRRMFVAWQRPRALGGGSCLIERGHVLVVWEELCRLPLEHQRPCSRAEGFARALARTGLEWGSLTVLVPLNTPVPEWSSVGSARVVV